MVVVDDLLELAPHARFLVWRWRHDLEVPAIGVQVLGIDQQLQRCLRTWSGCLFHEEAVVRAELLVDSPRSIELSAHRFDRRRDEPARCRSVRIGSGSGRWARDIRPLRGLYRQSPGSDEAGDLGVAKFRQQAPHVAVDRFLPDALAFLEVAANDGRGDAPVESCRVERQQAALPVADHSDRSLVFAVAGFKQVDGAEDFLYLVADKVAAKLVAHAE